MKSFKQKERISDLYTVGRLQKTLEMQKKNEDLKKHLVGGEGMV